MVRRIETSFEVFYLAVGLLVSDRGRTWAFGVNSAKSPCRHLRPLAFGLVRCRGVVRRSTRLALALALSLLLVDWQAWPACRRRVRFGGRNCDSLRRVFELLYVLFRLCQLVAAATRCLCLLTTFSDGCLGSNNDEGRSEV